MKFLIQTINNKIVHDFSFTLIESIKYQNWLGNNIKYRFTDSKLYKGYIPIGTVEFVSNYINTYFNKIPKPINIPDELLDVEFTRRNIKFGTNRDAEVGKFVKSADKIKSFTEIVQDVSNIPEGNYLISDVVPIDSEWRVFVFKNKIVGLQNYAGDFMDFPAVYKINKMVTSYTKSPPAYTLDVGVFGDETFIIEVHDFFSCGLYGFSDHKILPQMFSQWFYNFIK